MRFSIPLFVLFAFSCGVPADEVGVGAACASDDDCLQDTDPPIVCLRDFAGGYCGLSDCADNQDCPEGSVCVAHDDGENYCFRACVDKPECNANRPVDQESNCSSNVVLTDELDTKTCVPPTGS